MSMYEAPFTYPEVHIGDRIEFAPTKDTPDPTWILAEVERCKFKAVDVKLSNGMRRTDVRHIDDPALRDKPILANSGVFRLINAQVRLNKMFSEHEAMKRRMDALEQTFRAVMESQAPEAVPSPVGRRPGRPAGSMASM